MPVLLFRGLEDCLQVSAHYLEAFYFHQKLNTNNKKLLWSRGGRWLREKGEQSSTSRPTVLSHCCFYLPDIHRTNAQPLKTSGVWEPDPSPGTCQRLLLLFQGPKIVSDGGRRNILAVSLGSGLKWRLHSHHLGSFLSPLQYHSDQKASHKEPTWFFYLVRTLPVLPFALTSGVCQSAIQQRGNGPTYTNNYVYRINGVWGQIGKKSGEPEYLFYLS